MSSADAFEVVCNAYYQELEKDNLAQVVEWISRHKKLSAVAIAVELADRMETQEDRQLFLQEILKLC